MFTDIKYISYVSSRLRNFKSKGNNLYNFSCPYCMDSQKHLNKARGYLYQKHNTILYRCQKCSYGTTFSNLLKFLDPLLYKEYTLEKYKVNSNHNHTPKFEFPSSVPIFEHLNVISPLTEIYKISELSESHPAVQYVFNRNIPKDKWDLLYFCAKYVEWCKRYTDKEIKIDKDAPRLVIPTYNQDNKLIGWGGRAFGAEFLRYHIVKLEEDSQLIFGVERIDHSKLIKVVEGQIDSLFLDNCIASCGISSFDSPYTRENKDNIVLISDNEPRNIHIVKTLKKYIDLGYAVCLFPENIVGKDINEMIQSGITSAELEQIITNNTVKGASALLKLMAWRKV